MIFTLPSTNLELPQVFVKNRRFFDRLTIQSVSGTIDGAHTFVLKPRQAAIVVRDGNNWKIAWVKKTLLEWIVDLFR